MLILFLFNTTAGQMGFYGLEPNGVISAKSTLFQNKRIINIMNPNSPDS